MNNKVLLKQWEGIAREATLTKGLSRSELESIEIGITQSKDEILKGVISEMKSKAWKAKTVK